MKMKIISGISVALFVAGHCLAQTPRTFKTWIPAYDTVSALEGRGWTTGLNNYYDRLPAKAEKTVRTPVWNLSKNSAGMNLRFRSDADEIVVKYVVGGAKEMPHMPATGVSGVDLYAKSIDGQWLWCAGKYDFKDTIVYRFAGLKKYDQHVKNIDYTLYLPLYNSVKWLSVSVPEESLLQPLPVRKEAPVVIYGTSIAQGACATRPGLAWTSILGRKLESPVINLAFSGNGRLEPEVQEFVGQLDARLFVLDCLPNLAGAEYAGAELKRRITNAVTFLQQGHPGTPILLTEHDGYTGGDMNLSSKAAYKQANATLREVYDSLQKAGVKNISLLTEAEIGQDIESMVDGTHPNDIGMMHYADAYAKKIREILHAENGNTVTTTAVTQRRDYNTYDWETRHEAVMAYNKTHQPKVVFMGNSITNFWGGEPVAKVRNGSLSWEKYFTPKQAVNLGFGWDRVENVLWRVQHGELDGISPAYIVLMIGTNNLQANTDEEIATGLVFLLKNIQARQAAAKVILMGILPRKEMESRVVRINQLIAKRTAGKNIQFLDAGKLFLKADGKIDVSLFSDGLHPNQEGYERLGALINKYLKVQ
ncbi:SGNH/GDSL hydrolase family protein [Chitinophaga arvensicola]|uniref:Lysophospholipase L1 n=1 Tax=Chitinophaga arvensicola TaxID=29529 RepID=A0A1I0RNQ4_9BACT|nr:SGNH/GDSL hydrolase family protein [Chitinophaga arvensicola]SEW42887.1 Lysophospholipase L1 [Chitinophaga arvensicola]